MKNTLLFILLLYLPANALDTTEPLTLGFSDNEVYITTEGIGTQKEELFIRTTCILGAGITDRLSMTFSAVFDNILVHTENDLCLTLFIHVITIENFKGDLLVTLNNGGPLALTMEFNVDFKKWGIQLTLEEDIEDSPNNLHTRRFETSVSPLFYWALSNKGQLLTGFYFGLGEMPEPINKGSFCIGYNHTFNGMVELITEASIDLSQRAGAITVGILNTF